MASTSPKPTSNMQFIGAAQQSFDSFKDLTRFMLDIYWPDWNNTSNPSSYILPPTFSFLNPHKSDNDIQEIREEVEKQKQNGVANNSFTSLQRPVIDRCSDSGEFLVFHALWALVQDKVQAPFLAINGLDFDKIKSRLNQIFPHVQADIQEKFKMMMREYDFVLIGPKIGIIVIEVKSSAFTAKKDFRVEEEEESEKKTAKKIQRNLPDDIIKGINQLQSFDIEFFYTCSRIQPPPEVWVRRILFTPNLDKSRLEAWKSHLDEPDKARVRTRLVDTGIIHWFKEDLSNLSDHSEKPALYSRLREMIETPGSKIPPEIYESYGLIISGFGSALVLKNQTVVEMCDERIFTCKAILREVEALASHDPLQQLKFISLDSSTSKRKKLDDVIQIQSKLILLTREQRVALDGPNRQFIIGPPGTGKTIILQAKALQLLQKGKRTLVYTTRSYRGKYQVLFESHGFSRYEIREVSTNEESMLLPAEFIRRVRGATESVWENLESFSKEAMNNNEMRGCLNDFDAIFIDDAFDILAWYRNKIRQKHLLSLIRLMAIATNCKMSSKLVWIAADSYSYDPKTDRGQECFRRMLDQMIRGEQRHYFTCTILNRVMRSSESVYRVTYSDQLLQLLAVKPALGHKIHGFSEFRRLHNLAENEAFLEIWKQAEGAVNRLRREGFDYGIMAVIVGSYRVISIEEEGTLFDYLSNQFRQSGISVTRAGMPSPSSLTVDEWDEVSSHEWPIVIYIAMLRSTEEDTDESYHRYRVCSRATMKILQIIVPKEARWRKHAHALTSSLRAKWEKTKQFCK